MPYVQRDGAGHVTGLYAAMQAGYAEELLADNDPAVVAFLNPPVIPSFLARDLLAQLTSADYTAIQGAVAASADLGLLWFALLGQGDAPIVTTSARFKAGWAGIQQALGAARATQIATALGFAG